MAGSDVYRWSPQSRASGITRRPVFDRVGRDRAFGYWHLSEVVVPMRDVRSWGKTGSGQQWGEPTRLTQLGHRSWRVENDSFQPVRPRSRGALVPARQPTTAPVR
jgi:hypothetical protein